MTTIALAGAVSPAALGLRLRTAAPEEWMSRGETQALDLFQEMSREVPAYRAWLQRHGGAPSRCRTIADLAWIPAIDKDNYLRANTLADLSWRQSFTRGGWVISTTSGSTGKPYYFPRQDLQDEHYATIAEQYLRTNFRIQSRRTLYIIGFAMGPWIGGVFTYEALKQVSRRGYDLSILTAGTQKSAIVAAVKDLHRDFDQIIIGAYAPHLKDVIEDGIRAGIDWKSVNVKFVFSAEAFPEQFRSYLAEKVGFENIYRDTLNHYGTVDLGTMAHETPLSVLIRRRLVECGKLTALFPEPHRQPTLAQYIPELFYFEQRNGSLHCSANAGLPLFRYDLKDHGGIIGYVEMRERLLAIGIDMERELAAEDLGDTLWKLPFVYVYERKEMSVSYYAFYIYVDPIRKALHADELQNRVTGKGFLHSDFSGDGRARLTIHVELSAGVVASRELAAAVLASVHRTLLRESMEYADIHKNLGDVVQPVITLHPYQHPEFFSSGGKHKWK